MGFSTFPLASILFHKGLSKLRQVKDCNFKVTKNVQKVEKLLVLCNSYLQTIPKQSAILPNAPFLSELHNRPFGGIFARRECSVSRS